VTEKHRDSAFTIVKYETPRRLADYCNMHDMKFKLTETPEKIKSLDVRHTIEEMVAKPITDE